MKKVCLILFLSIIFLILPLGFLKASTTNCCKIMRSFKFAGTTYQSGKCYGEVSSTPCYRPDGKQLCPSSDLYEDENWGAVCLLNAVYGITDVVFGVLISLSILIALGGGYNVLTAGGDPDKLNKGRDLIIYAILGLLASFFARIVPSIVVLFMGR